MARATAEQCRGNYSCVEQVIVSGRRLSFQVVVFYPFYANAEFTVLKAIDESSSGVRRLDRGHASLALVRGWPEAGCIFPHDHKTVPFKGSKYHGEDHLCITCFPELQHGPQAQ